MIFQESKILRLNIVNTMSNQVINTIHIDVFKNSIFHLVRTEILVLLCQILILEDNFPHLAGIIPNCFSKNQFWQRRN